MRLRLKARSFHISKELIMNPLHSRLRVAICVSLLLSVALVVGAIPAFAQEADLNWNVSIGMIKPDEKLTTRLNAALDEMLADGTIRRIYARYGLQLEVPQ